MTIRQILDKACPEITRRFNQLELSESMVINLDGIEVEKNRWLNGRVEIYLTLTDLSYDEANDFLTQKISVDGIVVELSTSDDNEKPFITGQPLQLLKNAIIIHVENLITP